MKVPSSSSIGQQRQRQPQRENLTNEHHSNKSQSPKMPAKRNAQQPPATPLQQPATVPASSVTSSTTQPRTVTSKTFENKSALSSKKASASLKDFPTILQGVWENYVQHTPQRVKLIDTFLGFLLVVGVLQFAYCVLAGNYVGFFRPMFYTGFNHGEERGRARGERGGRGTVGD